MDNVMHLDDFESNRNNPRSLDVVRVQRLCQLNESRLNDAWYSCCRGCRKEPRLSRAAGFASKTSAVGQARRSTDGQTDLELSIRAAFKLKYHNAKGGFNRTHRM